MSNSRPDEINRQLAEAQRLIASKSYVEAEKILLNIVAARPADALAWHELGNARYRNKEYRKAVDAFHRRHGIEPDDPIANYSLGVALIELGRVDEARIYLKRALEIKHDFQQAKDRLGRLGPAYETRDKGPELQAIEVPQGPTYARADTAPSSSTPPESLSRELQRGQTDPGKLLWSGHQLRRIYWPVFMLAIGCALISLISTFTVNDSFRYEGVIGFLILLSIGMVISAAAAADSTRYRIYERRIDIERGIVSRSADSLWFFEVTNVTYEQPLELLLAGTAKIALQTEGTQLTYITGIASAQEMKKMWEEMRDSVLAQRRDIKGVWV